jgi:hypothetical protein
LIVLYNSFLLMIDYLTKSFISFTTFRECHERQLQGLERKAKVEGSQLRLYKAKEGSRKHEALHA